MAGFHQQNASYGTIMDIPGHPWTPPLIVDGVVHEEQNPLPERYNGTMLMETNGQFSLERTVWFLLCPQTFGVVQCSIVFLTNGCRRLYCLAGAARIYENDAPNVILSYYEHTNTT